MERRYRRWRRPCLLATVLLVQTTAIDLAAGVLRASESQLDVENVGKPATENEEYHDALDGPPDAPPRAPHWMHSSEQWGEPPASEVWKKVPAGRFDYLVSITGKNYGHRCNGVVIDRFWVLTAAHCIDIVGPNAIVHTNSPATGGAGPDAGVHVMVEATVFHPDWTGTVDGGCDAVLLRLHRPVDVQGPVLADPTFRAYASMQLFVLALRGVPQEAVMVKMTVVANHLCPGTVVLSPDKLCLVSNWEQLEEGDSGGLALILYSPGGPNDLVRIEEGSPDLDLLVAMVSATNLSFTEGNSGAVLERMMSIRPWIFSVVHRWDVHRQGEFANSPAGSQRQLRSVDLSQTCSGAVHLLGHKVLELIVAIVVVLATTSLLLWISKGARFRKKDIEAQLIAGQVPDMLAHYVPRPDLELAAQKYLKQRQEPGARLCVSIEGMAGCGKTSLAVAIVRRGHLDTIFKAGILWMNVRQHRGNTGKPLVQLFHNMYSHMLELIEGQLIANSGFSGWKERDYVLAINTLVKGKKFLLVVDGLRDKVVLEAVLKVDCALIVTSQMRDALGSVAGVLKLQVGPLTNKASWQLLRNVAGKGADDKAAAELLEHSEGHPLLLCIMGKGLGGAFDMKEAAKLAEIQRLLTLVRNKADKVHLVMEDLDSLNDEAQDRHTRLSRCLESALDGLTENERRCFILLVVLPRGTYASHQQLHRLWNLGSAELTEHRISGLEGRYLLHRRKNGTFGLHSLQHDFLYSITSTQQRYKTLVEDARCRLANIEGQVWLS